MRYNSLTELKNAVQTNGGVMTVDVADIRDAYGAQRLGSQVREEVIRRLKSLGLEHRPKTFPHYQEERVRLFIKDSPPGRLIRDVEHIAPAADRRIRAAAARDGVIQQIRELVGATNALRQTPDDSRARYSA